MTEVWRLDGVDLGRLDRLASRIALTLKTGDVVTLSGPLGAGKTTLARTLVGHFDRGSEVPSPTFALIQRYDTPRLALSHCDFYRLDDGHVRSRLFEPPQVVDHPSQVLVRRIFDVPGVVLGGDVGKDRVDAVTLVGGVQHDRRT